MTAYNSARFVQLESIEILPSDGETAETYHGQQSFQFKCTLCPLQFNDKPKFHSHVRDHFKPITCPDCSKTFIGDKQYTYHRKHVHPGSEAMNTTTENVVHQRTTTKIEIKSELEIEEEMSVDSTIETVAASVACDICGRLFPNTASVVRHRKTHSNEGKRFFCGVCSTGFNKKTNLEFHLRIHTNERPFQCDQCPKSFAHVSGLNCHRRVHTGERPYTCPFCPKSYAHSTDLRRHRRTHGMEEKRFACDQCGKQFFENKFLRSHMRAHHRDDDGKKNSRSGSGATTTTTTSIEISKFDDECINEEYIDYEYIHSD